MKVLLGFYVRKDTPDNIRNILVDACKKTYDDPEFKKKIDELGGEPRFGNPEFIRATNK